MRVRALDSNGDWTFGKGQSDYLLNKKAVEQNIQTRLLEFLGDCFWNLGAGIDWFTFLGSKDQISLNLAVSSVIINTTFVASVVQVSIVLEPLTRLLTITYTVITSFGLVTDTIELPQETFLTTEAGDIITTEDGNALKEN